MCYFRSDFGYQEVKGGPIYFVGRRDQQVKIRGHRVECMEVEVLFKSKPSVKNCAVIASDKLGNSVQLFLFCTTNGLSTTKEENIVDGIYAWGQRNLPGYMIPSRIIVLAILPTLPNGKLDRQSLRESVRKKMYNVTSSTNSSTSNYRKNRYEKYTLKLWGNVLGLENEVMKNVLLLDSFLFYGGNSLNFVQLIQRIRRDFRLKTEDLALSDVVENHTVKSMSELISKLPGAETCINRLVVSCKISRLYPMIMQATLCLQLNAVHIL